MVLTEVLCEAEADERGLDVRTAPPARLDQRAAVELGSINAAAFEGSAAVRAVYEAVTADVTVPWEQVAAYTAATARPPVTEWRLSTPDGEFDAAPHTLPGRLVAALAAAGPGRAVTVDGFTAALVDVRSASRPSSGPGDGINRVDGPVSERSPSRYVVDAARRLAFVRWLDRTRARRLRLVPGLEHPGDPAQPDNHHRH